MATYIPNATQTTEPVESRTVESAALEFRTLKTSINARIEDVQDNLDTEIVNRIAGDANLQTQNNAQDIRLTAVENALLSIGEGGLPGTVYVQRFSGTGVQTAFTLNAAPQSGNAVDIYINGIYQNKDTFSVAGAVITFSEAPPAGADNIEVQVTVTIALGETDASLVTYNATTVEAQLDSVEAQLDAISAASGSSLVGFQQAGTGAVSTTVQSKLRKTIHVTDYGIGSGVTDDHAKIQTLLNEVSAAGGGEIIFDSEEDYLVTDCILVPSNLVLRFTGNGYVRLTQSSTIGAVMVVFGTAVTPAENVTIYNPRIDAGNFGHPTSAVYGENGIGGSKCRNVQIFGGLVKNCRRGSSNPVGTGGKAVQFEGGVEDILVDGLTAIDCTIAMETGGSPDLTGYERYRNVQYKNMRAFNCDRIISVMHSTSPPDASVAVGLVQIDGVLAFNCGRESVAGTEKNFGAITIDRASNVTIKNVVIANESEYGTLGAVVRQASGTNCDIDVSITGSADALVLHAVGSTGFGTTGTCQDNIYKVTHKGTAGYAISHVADVTLQENLYHFVTDVISTGFVDVAAALGSLYCTFVSGGKATVVQGTALAVYAYLANTYPAQNFAVGGTVSINGLIITLGSGSRVITTVGTDQLLLQYAGSQRVTLNANGVLLGGLPTYADNAAATAAGLAVGQLYRTATGQIFIRY